ncbi:hypothetical protein AAEX28_06005 [Lentisphaerota bacterium WC36G]|nr:hypothetical protein LJT99_08865 [Lentisphaerae bacterium WC36]
MLLFQSNNRGGVLSLIINIFIIFIAISLIFGLIIIVLPIIIIYWLIAKIFGKQPPININNIKNQYHKMNSKQSFNNSNQHQEEDGFYKYKSDTGGVDDIIDVKATEVNDKK